eukprot:gene16217-9079_t
MSITLDSPRLNPAADAATPNTKVLSMKRHPSATLGKAADIRRRSSDIQRYVLRGEQRVGARTPASPDSSAQSPPGSPKRRVLEEAAQDAEGSLRLQEMIEGAGGGDGTVAAASVLRAIEAEGLALDDPKGGGGAPFPPREAPPQLRDW